MDSVSEKIKNIFGKWCSRFFKTYIISLIVPFLLATFGSFLVLALQKQEIHPLAGFNIFYPETIKILKQSIHISSVFLVSICLWIYIDAIVTVVYIGIINFHSDRMYNIGLTIILIIANLIFLYVTFYLANKYATVPYGVTNSLLVDVIGPIKCKIILKSFLMQFFICLFAWVYIKTKNNNNKAHKVVCITSRWVTIVLFLVWLEQNVVYIFFLIWPYLLWL